MERKLSRAIESTESELEALEVAIEEIETALTLPEVFGDHEKVQDLHDQLLAQQEKQDHLLHEWESLTLELENL